MPDAHVSADQFAALFDSLSNWGQWGADDERGALNLLTAERVASAARLVLEGRTVTLSLPLNTESGAAQPGAGRPSHDAPRRPGAAGRTRSISSRTTSASITTTTATRTSMRSAMSPTRGRCTTASPRTRSTEQGATVNTIEVLRDGLIGRAVLLDIPRVRGVSWLEPGEHVFAEDLVAAERAQGVQVRTGDILLVRTGHPLRLARLGPWDTPAAKAGLHPTAMRFVFEREVAVLGSDGNNDTAPSSTEGVDFPIHVLAICAMGVHLLDYLQFEDLREECERQGRWEFLFAAAPLRIVNGTGSPLNPVAVF